MRKSRFISTLIALCIAVGMLAGCTVIDNTPAVTIKDKKDASNEIKVPAAVIALYFIGEQNYMLNQAGVSTEEEAKEFFRNDENLKTARNNAADSAVKTEVICRKAKELGVALTEEEKTQIDVQINSQMTADFKKQLKDNGSDVDAYKYYAETNMLASKLYEELCKKDAYQLSAEELKETNETYVKAKHILISTVDPATNEKLSEDKVAEARAQAEDLYKQIKDGADFDELMNKYSTDPGLQSAPDGYEFGKGEMVPEFEETTYALEIGEVSEPVETDYGYHIIKRVELVDKIKEAQSVKIDADVEKWQAEANVEISEKALSKLKAMQ